MVYFVKHYRHYLYRFLIRMDHGALKYIFNFKDPQGQMARWLQILDRCTFVRLSTGLGRGMEILMPCVGPLLTISDAESPVQVIMRTQAEKQTRIWEAA